MGSIIHKATLPEPPPTFNEMVAVLQLAQSKPNRIQKKAARLMHRFTLISEECCEQLVREGGIKLLVTLFHSKSPDVQDLALRALAEISKARTCQDKLLDIDTILVIIEALNSKRPEFRVLAFSCIDLICHIERASHMLVQEGAVPGILTRASEDYVLDQPDSCNPNIKAIQILLACATEHNIQRMIYDGAIGHLFSIINSALRTTQHKTLSMQLLCHLCSHQDSHRWVSRLFGGTGLLRIVSLIGSANEAIGIYAAIAVSHLAGSDRTHADLLRSGALPALVALLRRTAPAATAAALDALAALARTARGRDAVGDAGCIRRTLRLAQSSDGGVAGRAVRLLGVLAQAEPNRRRIFADGGRAALQQASGPEAAGGAEVQQAAAELLLQLEAAHRDELVLTAVNKLRGNHAAAAAAAAADSAALDSGLATARGPADAVAPAPLAALG